MEGHTSGASGGRENRPDGPGARPTIREQVAAELGDEAFEAAVLRQTGGTPSYPEPSQTRYERLSGLPDEPFDAGAVFAELVVFSATHVYRWTESGTAVDVTRVPRSPEAVSNEP